MRLWVRGAITFILILLIASANRIMELGALPMGALIGLAVYWFYQGVSQQPETARKNSN